MARIRYLKPDFFKDEDLKELSFEVRLVYAGLWCQADREGRLEDRTERLKVEIMPYDDVDIEKCLKVLAGAKKGRKKPYIQRYEANGNNYIQILEWHRHQKPHHTEKESEIPAPLKISINNLNKGISKGKGNGDGEDINRSTELSNGSLTVKKPLNTSSANEKTMFLYPVVGKNMKEWTLTESKFNEYKEAFPGVDVWQESKNALQWCRDNPTKRKTSKGMPAFLTRWFTREQNKGGKQNANFNKAGQGTTDEELKKYD